MASYCHAPDTYTLSHWSCCCRGVVAGLSAFITSAAQFMTLRLLLGVAECGAFPGMAPDPVPA